MSEALAHRSGQATVEWVAVLVACVVLAVGALQVVRAGLATLPDPQALLLAAAGPEVATSPGIESPTMPTLRMHPLPPAGGGGIVTIAERLLARGIAEQPPGSNRSPEILVFTDGNAEAWCADFVSWVLRAAGAPFTGGASGGWRLAWTPDVRAWFLARGRYRPRLTADPQPGDVIWFGHGHVGLVRRVVGSTVETIEGNSDDRLALRTYPGWRANTRIDGFGRPLVKPETRGAGGEGNPSTSPRGGDAPLGER